MFQNVCDTLMLWTLDTLVDTHTYTITGEYILVKFEFTQVAQMHSFYEHFYIY